MSDGQSAKTTRRSFLGTATVATAATLAAPVGGAADNAGRANSAGLTKVAAVNSANENLAAAAKVVTGRSQRQWPSPRRDISSLKGTIRSNFSQDSGQLWLHAYCQDQTGSRRSDPSVRKNNRERHSWQSVRSRPAQTSLPEMGPLQHRWRNVFHVSGDFRH